MDFCELITVLGRHRCTAEPIVPDGWVKPNGYNLSGPRGNKLCLAVDANGDVDGERIKVWLDGIEYASKK